MGARPMYRLVKSMLTKPLADELLFGSLADCPGGTVAVTLENNELKINVGDGE
jgi:ATP-dependent Clp protease ATP-binding subunit ClpA